MTRAEAKAKISKGIDVIRQKHPNGGAFDYIKATGGISIIDKIYDDFEEAASKSTCQCKMTDSKEAKEKND